MVPSKILFILKTLIALTLLFLVLTVGFGIYAYIQSYRAPIEPIKGQIQALNEGRIEDAFNQFTAAEFKKKTSFKDFANLVETNPQIFKSKSSEFDKVRITDNKAVVGATIVGQDKTETPMTYTLTCQNNKWLIIGFKQGSNNN